MVATAANGNRIRSFLREKQENPFRFSFSFLFAFFCPTNRRAASLRRRLLPKTPDPLLPSRPDCSNLPGFGSRATLWRFQFPRRGFQPVGFFLILGGVSPLP